MLEIQNAMAKMRGHVIPDDFNLAVQTHHIESQKARAAACDLMFA